MIQVHREDKGGVSRVTLAGEVIEHVDLDQLVGKLGPRVDFVCRGVTRINSAGTKAWIRYFLSLKDKATKFRFIDCSFALVEQFNFISDMSCGGEIASVMVPFTCADCKKSYDLPCTADRYPKPSERFPGGKCPGCGKVNEMDEEPAEYFEFVGRMGGR